MAVLDVLLRMVAGAGGVALVLWTVGGALRTVVLPRATSSWQVTLIFGLLRRVVFDPLTRPRRGFEARDRIMAMYAPVGLLMLPAMWATFVVTGCTGVFWAFGVRPFSEAFVTSGSSLLTLGFVRPHQTGLVIVSFAEAFVGLGLVSLLISYLPTIYGSFSRREAYVAMLEVRAGQPPSPSTLLVRYHRIGWLDGIAEEFFALWEQWFVEVEESHTSLPVLVFFRSPLSARSWITAAGCVLDTAALASALLDRPKTGRDDIVLRTGFLALRRIADGFSLAYPADPAPSDPISISRTDFDEVCAELEAAGIALKPDRDQAWTDFAGWRVNYDAALLGLCDLVMAPPARWSSDRSAGWAHPNRTAATGIRRLSPRRRG